MMGSWVKGCTCATKLFVMCCAAAPMPSSRFSQTSLQGLPGALAWKDSKIYTHTHTRRTIFFSRHEMNSGLKGSHWLADLAPQETDWDIDVSFSTSKRFEWGNYSGGEFPIQLFADSWPPHLQLRLLHRLARLSAQQGGITSTRQMGKRNTQKKGAGGEPSSTQTTSICSSHPFVLAGFRLKVGQ